jgi:zinc transporter, ZIP family
MEGGMNDILFAFGLTLLAGLSTGIGSAIALFTNRTNTRFLALSLGFSAGVMIYVSMVELFFEARAILSAELGSRAGAWISVLAFFGGMLVIGLIDRFVPKGSNPHDMYMLEDIGESHIRTRALMRVGVLTALAIAIHNFPEGIATFISALQDPSISIPVAIAIAIHNIPEGIAVSVPVYYATGDRRKAFRYSFLSGLSEPLGALFAYVLLMPFMSDLVMGVMFASVAGIMVFISLDELLPAAREYGEHHLNIYGVIAGMAVMALSLLLFE